jgi:hypothetical protein
MRRVILTDLRVAELCLTKPYKPSEELPAQANPPSLMHSHVATRPAAAVAIVVPRLTSDVRGRSSTAKMPDESSGPQPQRCLRSVLYHR